MKLSPAILLLALFIHFSNQALAQVPYEPEVKKKRYVDYAEINKQHASIYFQTGYHYGDYKAINKTLADSSFATFKTSDWAFGAGFNIRLYEFMMQIDFYKMTQCVLNSAKSCSHLNFVSSGISFGYLLTRQHVHFFYPQLGVYRNRTEFILGDYSQPSTNAPGYLTGSKNVTQITRHNYSLNIGLAYDFKWPISGKYELNFLLGMRAGYSLTLNEGTWYEHIDEIPLDNGPRSNPAGAYFKVVGGFCF